MTYVLDVMLSARKYVLHDHMLYPWGRCVSVLLLQLCTPESPYTPRLNKVLCEVSLTDPDSSVVNEKKWNMDAFHVAVK
jgi:hypothetical protein